MTTRRPDRASPVGSPAASPPSAGSGAARGGTPGGLVLVGRFGAPHGVRGEIRVKAYTGEPMALAGYAGLTDAEGKRSFRIESARPVKDDLIVARLAGVRDRDAAQALTNTDIYLPREALPPAGEEEFYVAELVGLRAELADGALFGRVAAVLNYGAGDILEIAIGAEETCLVPFTRACAPVVDMAGGRIVVAPPVEVDGEEPPGGAPGEGTPGA